MQRRSTQIPYTTTTLKQKFGNSITIPEFQRGLVWTVQQKKELIDTIINDFDIPKLYFAKSNDGKFSVIDGQQRLNAIIGYMGNRYPLDSDATYYENSEISIGNTFFKVLPVNIQSSIEGYILTVVECEGFTEEMQKELFERLQNGTSLNSPEKRRSMKGDMPKMVTTLSNHQLFAKLNNQKKGAKLLNKPDSRFSHEDIVAKIMLDIGINNIATASASNLKHLYKDNKSITDSDQLVLETITLLDFFYECFKDKEPKFSQVDFRRLAYIAHTMFKELNIKSHKNEFADAYIEFNNQRTTTLLEIKEDETGEKEQEFMSIKFKEYTEKARSYDAAGQEKMDETLRSFIHTQIPTLKSINQGSNFTQNQRIAILFRAKNKCQTCSKPLNITDMQADHIRPRNPDDGGQQGETTLENGQALCQECNLIKSNSTA